MKTGNLTQMIRLIHYALPMMSMTAPKPMYLIQQVLNLSLLTYRSMLIMQRSVERQIQRSRKTSNLVLNIPMMRAISMLLSLSKILRASSPTPLLAMALA